MFRSADDYRRYFAENTMKKGQYTQKDREITVMPFRISGNRLFTDKQRKLSDIQKLVTTELQ